MTTVIINALDFVLKVTSDYNRQLLLAAISGTDFVQRYGVANVKSTSTSGIAIWPMLDVKKEIS